MRHGELWTVVSLDHPKPRPAIILSVDAWNAHALDVIVVPLTTQSGPSRPEVHHADLRKPTYAKCGGIGTLPKSHLKHRFGRVDEQTLDLISFELRRLLGLS